MGAHPQAFLGLPSLLLSTVNLVSVTGTCLPFPCGGSWLGFRDLLAMGAVPIWELAVNRGSSWMSQEPNLHVAMQLLNRITYNNW